MIELLRVLQAFPRPIKVLAPFVIFLPVSFVAARALGLNNRMAGLFVLGVFVIILLFMAFNALLKAGQRKKARTFEGTLGAHSKQAGLGKEEIREALAELSEKWQLAVRQLREAGMSIYDLPWYLLIGEPQSGKSTTLKNSGLEFPVGQEALSGAGGTRNCDWWFSNEAVILDTAGRFTFQEESAPDAHEWESFLKLLVRNRRQCPINGIVVVIPATSLVEDAPEEQERKAKNIRAKLMHVQKVLEIRVPVFVLVTKADRILGFTEFFTRLDPIDQRQLFGWSNPDPIEKAWDPKSFGEVFAAIVNRVHKLRLRLMQDEPNLSQVDKMFVFPEELEAIQEPLFGYFHTMFSGSRFEEPFIFRGFYITSGVQQGRPIARACRDLLRVSAGDPQGVLENLEQVFTKARAFFIRDFYEKKAFQEQGLIARTRAAQKRDRVNRYVLYGLAAVVIPLLVFALGTAAFNLYTRLRPIDKAVADARHCLDATRPCTLKESWELVDRLEMQKRHLTESRWLMRLMLRGGARNEITAQLIPAIQGQLLVNGVLPPLLASFDTRAQSLRWGEHYQDYLSFLGGFQTILRMTEHRAATQPERLPELRRDLRLEPILSICLRTRGLDPSSRGKDIDDWLAGPVNSADVDAVFRAAVAARSAVASVPAPEPVGCRRAFREFWTARNLGHWEPTLYFKTYADLQDEILRMDAAYGAAEGTLGSFADVARRFAQNYDDGASIMKGDRPESAARRPGLTVTDWVANCRDDHAALTTISPRAGVEGGRCSGIPAEWEALVGRREDYRHLYLETPGQGAGVTWSDNAGKLKVALADLAKLADSADIKVTTTKLEGTLAGLGSASERLDEAGRYYKDQEKLVLAPADAVSAWDAANPPAPFESVRTARRVRELSALTLAARTLSPVASFFSDQVFRGCTDCYTKYYASNNVPAANKFVNWARRTFEPIRSQEQVSRAVDAVNSAMYDYLRSMLGRSGGGGGGPSLNVPDRALRAYAWAEFVREMRTWRVVSEGGGSSGGGGGLTVDDIQEYVRDNDALRPLLREAGGGRRGPAAGPPEELLRSAQAFQRCVSGLEETALRAWKQLVAEKALLADFHGMTANPRLRGVPEADRLRPVEAKAAELLVKEIRPDYQERSKELWKRVDRCCADRFPFISERNLRRLRDLYARGPQRVAGNELWSPVTLDTTRRESSVTLTLETATREALDQLLYEDETFDRLFSEFALVPIVDGEEKSVDFVGEDKERLRAMRRWQAFLYPEDRAERGRKPEVTIRLIERGRGGGQTFIGERVGRVDLFGPNTIRPSNPAVATPALPLLFEDRPLAVVGINEDRNGWTGRLDLRGGPLKLVYFVLLAAEGRPRQEDRVWTIRVEIPDFERPDLRPEGLFELTFDRPLPAVFPEGATSG